MALKDVTQAERERIVAGLDLLIASSERAAKSQVKAPAVSKAFLDQAEADKIVRQKVVTT